MAPPSRMKKARLRKIKAAIDALKPMGFSRKEIRKTLNDLLKLYGDEGWIFFEEASYKMVIDIMVDKHKEDSTEKDSKEEEKAQDEASGTEVCRQPVQPREEKISDDKTLAEIFKQPIDPDISIDQNSRHEEANQSYNGTPVNLEVSCSQVRKRPPCYGWICESEDEDESQGPSVSFNDDNEQNKAKENRACAAVVKNNEKEKATMDFVAVYGNQIIKDTQTQSVVNIEQESLQKTGDSFAIRDHQGVGHSINPIAAVGQQTEAKGIEQERSNDVRDVVASADTLAVNDKQNRPMNNTGYHTSVPHQKIKDGRDGTTPSIARGPLAVGNDRAENSLAVDHAPKEDENAKHSPFLCNENERADNAKDLLEVDSQQQKPSIAGGLLELDNAHKNIEVHKECPAVSVEHYKIKDGKSSFTVYDEQDRDRSGVDNVSLSPAVIGDCERVDYCGNSLARDNGRGSHSFSNMYRMIKESGGSSEFGSRKEKDKPSRGPLASANAHQRVNYNKGSPENNEHKKIKNDTGHSANVDNKRRKDDRGSLAVSNTKESIKHGESSLASRDDHVRIKETGGPTARKQHERVERRGPGGSSVIIKEHGRMSQDRGSPLINTPGEMSRDARDSTYNSKHERRFVTRISPEIQYKLASSDEDNSPREMSRDARDSIYYSKHERRSDARISSGTRYKLVSSDEDNNPREMSSYARDSIYYSKHERRSDARISSGTRNKLASSDEDNAPREMSRDATDSIYYRKHERSDARISSGTRYKLASSDDDNAPREMSRDARDSIYYRKRERRSDARISSGIQYKLASSDEDDARGFSASKHYEGSSKEVSRGHFSFNDKKQKIGDLNGSYKGMNMKQRYKDSRGSNALDPEQETMMDSRDSPTNKYNYEQARFEKPKGTDTNNNDQGKTNKSEEYGKFRIRKRSCGWDVTPTDLLDFC